MKSDKHQQSDLQRGIGAALKTIYPPERSAQDAFDRLLEQMKDRGERGNGMDQDQAR